MMITLHNVIDIRTGQFYSVAIVSERKRKFFVPANDNSDKEVDNDIQ